MRDHLHLTGAGTSHPVTPTAEAGTQLLEKGGPGQEHQKQEEK